MTAPAVLVSVVMPIRDAAPFLREAVESVRAQTYPSWELLLVDDGSTDGSAAIARTYAEQHPDRIRYLEHPGHANLGCSATRNLGYGAARGEILANLDADDVWLPEKLAAHVPVLLAHPEADAVYGATCFWYGWTGDPADAARDHVPDLGIPAGTVVAGRDLLRRNLHGTARSPATCSLLTRAEAVRRVGGFVEEFRGMHEDQAFYARLFLDVSVVVAPGCLERYRRFTDGRRSLTARHEAPGALTAARLRYLDWMAAHLASHGLGDDEMWRVVDDTRRALRAPARPTLGDRTRAALAGVARAGRQLLRPR